MTIAVKSINIIILFWVLHTHALSAATTYLKMGVGMSQYVKFKETGEYKRKSLKEGALYNVGIGYKFTKILRTDLNFQYNKAKYKHTEVTDEIGVVKQTITTGSIFVNGYYDCNFYNNIIPYVSAGIGVSINNAGRLTETISGEPDQYLNSKKTTNFIWNIGIGIQYYFKQNIVLDLEYRYINLGTLKTDDHDMLEGGKQHTRKHQIMSSLVYHF